MSFLVTSGPATESITHSEGDKAVAAPEDRAAARCPAITDIRRSASRWIVIGLEEARYWGFEKGSASIPSSDKVYKRVSG